MKLIAKLVLVMSVGILPACMTVPKGVGDYDTGYKERGQASWYGDAFHGKLTASGEIYDQYALTAAHRMLPLGSLVRVTNSENGRTVEVVINDRGPFIAGRIIDLSYAAAERLDMVDHGTMPVFLEVARDLDAFEVLSADEQAAHRAFTGALKLELGPRYGDTWIGPAGTGAGSKQWRPLGDLRDERRSRRLWAILADETPSPTPLQDQEPIS